MRDSRCFYSDPAHQLSQVRDIFFKVDQPSTEFMLLTPVIALTIKIKTTLIFLHLAT